MEAINVSALLIGIIVIAFFTEVIVQIEKQVVKEFPANLLALISATITTILGAVGYVFYAHVKVTPTFVIGVIALALLESYIAMFGYDKLIQLVTQYKKYIDDKSDKSSLN